MPWVTETWAIRTVLGPKTQGPSCIGRPAGRRTRAVYLITDQGPRAMASEEPEKAALPEYPVDWFSTRNSRPVCTIDVLLSDQVLRNTVHGGL